MVSFADVKRWNTGHLDDILRTMQDQVQILTHSGDDYGKVVPVDGWTGEASDNAGFAHRSLMSRMDKLAAGASIISKAIGEASDAIPAVQRAIANAEEFARTYGYQIADNGAIIDTFPEGKAPPDINPSDRARAKTEITDDIAQTMRTADDIDADLASVLKRAATGEFGTGDETTVSAAAADGAKDPGLTLLEPPQNGTPSQNAGWWNAMSPAGQAILLHDHPDWLGNLDGLPGSVRSQANIARIPAIRADLQRQLDQANKDAEGPAIGDDDLQIAADKINAIQAKLDSLDTIQSTMAQGDRQLLFIDASQPRVEAAIAVGNVDTAKNIAVFTPGFTTTVNGDLGEYDNDMYNLKKTSDRMDALHGGGSTATVTWIGYQAPQADGGLVDPSQSVASPEAAKAGGDSLAKFYNGLGASHAIANAPLHLTALGHSYGSTTTGFALGHDTPVNDAMLFGSPGQGSQHLNVPAGHLFDEHDAGDVLVPAVHGTLGPSPYYSGDAIPNYQQLSTDTSTTDMGQLNSTSGHGGYLDNNSTSLYNMAAITTGHPDLAVTYQPPPAPDPSDVHTLPTGGPPPPPPGPAPQPVPSPPGQDPTPPPAPPR
jgi:hypothetical protein